jgi:hypothetical protein
MIADALLPGQPNRFANRIECFFKYLASSLIVECEISNQGDWNQAAVLEAGIS